MRFKDRLNYDNFVADAKFQGDNLDITYVQKNDPILKDLALRKKEQNDNGFSHDRSMRFIGTIPAAEIAKIPELGEDTDLMLKWFESPVGRQFCVNKPNTGRSGKVIIK